MSFLEQIEVNNRTHVVSKEELEPLLAEAKKIYNQHFDGSVYFERSVFINWTCGIADCKYCYLSTQPKLAPNAKRHPASILAEVLICKLMGWKVGYITGGLRVESKEYMAELLSKIEAVYGEKIMMNFGPYTKSEVDFFKDYVTGMGSAIESFDEELHKYICPSKPLTLLLSFLGHLQQAKLKKLITIILGIGEKKDDIQEVIANIKKYGIDTVQLCFLKPQENTVFDNVPPPNPQYMAWWIATLRIACPQLRIKIALVRERIEDTALYLEAGANDFSRFMIFKDFGSTYATQLEESCVKAGRSLQGSFKTVPGLDIETPVAKLPFDDDLKNEILKRTKQYMKRLEKLAAAN